MAHGAILYSGQVNFTLPYTATPPQSSTFDVNGDGVGDFSVGFVDILGSVNPQKPYIEGDPSGVPGSAVLVGPASDTLPDTQFGVMIDEHYLAPTTNSSGNAFFFYENDDSSGATGGWSSSAYTEGYVGMELWDGDGNTNYAWVHIIYDGAASPKTLTVVDYAYETTPFTGIMAGQYVELGSPYIYTPPESQTAGVGGNVQFVVTALGVSPLTYHWEVGPTNGAGPYTPLTDGGVVSGSTNATLTINGATAANLGAYRVVISNALGTTNSTPATLTLISPEATPTPQVLFSGLTASFQVSISAGLSPTYQWQENGTNLSDGGRIAGSKTSRLQISNLQMSDAANYGVVLTINSSQIPSALASLTVLPASQESIYDAAVLAAGPVAYYRLNETGNPANGSLLAYDNAGGFNGIYGIDVTNAFGGVAGPVATNGFPGFAANSAAVFISPNDTNSWITLSPWKLNTNNVTFTAWVKPAALPNDQAGILFTGTTNGTDAGLNYYYETNEIYVTNDITTNAIGIQLAYTWNEGPGNDQDEFFQSGLYTPTNEWSFVAVSITSSNAILYVFNAEGTNSVVDESYLPTSSFDPNGSTNQVMAFNNPEYIGSDPNGAPFGEENFNGSIAAVAVFNQTLSSNQLQTIYSAALGTLPPVNLQIASVGTNIQLTWPMGRLLQATSLNGPWTTNNLATPPYTVAPSGSMFYRVIVP